MNKNVLYGLVFIVLFFAIILPDVINPSKGLIFILEESVMLFLFLIGFLLFRNLVARIVEKLNHTYPWRTALGKRILVQVGIILLSTFIISTVILLPSVYYLNKNGVPEFYQKIVVKKNEINAKGDWPKRLTKNIIDDWQLSDLITVIGKATISFLLLLFILEEGYVYFSSKSRKKLELETLKKEQAQLKANVLSKQLDPHFMFNTLNVLSGLVYKDPDKSVQFIKELSQVYRYVLEQSEELVSTVEQEFHFLESYMYLLKIRFDDKIPVTIDIPADKKKWLMPSMTLELLVENAIKHNVVDRERPLNLHFTIKNDQLIVKNNLQLRNDISNSLGIGLDNLKKRLDLLDEKKYSFNVVGNEFVAIVPLINPKDV